MKTIDISNEQFGKGCESVVETLRNILTRRSNKLKLQNPQTPRMIQEVVYDASWQDLLKLITSSEDWRSDFYAELGQTIKSHEPMRFYKLHMVFGAWTVMKKKQFVTVSEAETAVLAIPVNSEYLLFSDWVESNALFGESPVDDHWLLDNLSDVQFKMITEAFDDMYNKHVKRRGSLMPVNHRLGFIFNHFLIPLEEELKLNGLKARSKMSFKSVI